MALSVLDAGVLIALLDPADRHHGAARAALDAYAGDDLRTPAHTLAEALVHPARAGREREARRLLALIEITVDPVEERVAVAAARLRAAHGPGLRLPDALVIAYGNAVRARRVLTADSRWAAWSPRVEVLGAGSS